VQDEREQRGTPVQELQDRDDLNNEIAGRETGRAKRFFPLGGSAAEAERREEDEWAAFVAHLTCQERIELLAVRFGELDRASLIALQEAEARRQEAEDVIDGMKRNASLDREGRRAYRSADGRRAFYEDGRELTPAQLAEVNWKGGAPTWEERKDAEARHRRALREIDEIGAYRDWLSTARERLNGGEVLTEAEIRELEAGAASVPEPVRAALLQAAPQMSASSASTDSLALTSAELAELGVGDSGAAPLSPVGRGFRR
jgi:hypothetical protein